MSLPPPIGRSPRPSPRELAARSAAARHAQRAGGQATAVASMIAEGRSFGEVAQQVLAARGSLDALLLRLLDLELDGRLPPHARTEVTALVGTALGRRSGSRLPTADRPLPRS